MSVEIVRDFSLGINFIEIMVELEIFMMFLLGWRKYKVEGGIPDTSTLTTAFAFLSGAFARGFYMVYDYYIPDELFRYIAWTFLIGCVILIVISLFGGVTRKVFRDFPHKILYTITVAIFVVILVVVRLLDGLSFWIFLIILGFALMVPIIYQFTKWFNKFGGYIKRNFRIAAAGVPLTFVGIGLGAVWNNFPEFEGWLLKIGAHIIFLVGLTVFALALRTLPTLSEFGWEDKLHNLYVLLPGGLLAFDYKFRETKDIDSDLLGSGLSGIVDIVKEMTGSVKRMKIIRQEKNNIYLEYGEHATVAIIAEEELKILFEKITRFTREFEELFAEKLEKWDGNTEIFEVADSLVKKIFTPL